jgi:hypothetical protein
MMDYIKSDVKHKNKNITNEWVDITRSQVETYMRQINDISKLKEITDISFNGNLKWEYLYVVERPMSLSHIKSALQTPFVANFSLNKIKCVGTRENMAGFANETLFNTFWNGTDPNKMKCVLSGGILIRENVGNELSERTFASAIRDREKEVFGE